MDINQLDQDTEDRIIKEIKENLHKLWNNEIVKRQVYLDKCTLTLYKMGPFRQVIQVYIQLDRGYRDKMALHRKNMKRKAYREEYLRNGGK
jgi:hypothetical protein